MAKAGNRWFWRIWCFSRFAESGESVVLADSEAKLEIGGFGRFGAKLGIDLFAGKSEITEGCSDFREIGDSSDLPGISDVRLSKSYGSDAAGDANFGAAVAGPSPVPVLLLEQSPWVLGSTEQIKADGGDGRGDLRAESFEGPVFSGDRDGNLARCRSWAVGRRPAEAGGGALSGRIWRELQKGAWTAGRRRAKLGRCRWASGRAGRKLAESAELLLASPNWGRFIAMSAYRGGMPEAGFTGMLDLAAVPMIFACWAARFVAARWTGRALRTGALRQKPAGRAGLGFLPSTAREFAKRRAEQDGKTQRGRGFWG